MLRITRRAFLGGLAVATSIVAMPSWAARRRKPPIKPGTIMARALVLAPVILVGGSGIYSDIYGDVY